MNEDTTYLPNKEEEPDVKNGKKQTKKKRGTIAALTGAAVGGSAAIVIGKIVNTSDLDKVSIESEESSHSSHNNVVSSTPKSSSGHAETLADAGEISDKMSYAEAFSAAREQIGPGGIFEWRGTLCSTYTADEWNALTDEERTEYNNLLDWDQIDEITGDMSLEDLLDSQNFDISPEELIAATEDLTTEDPVEIEVLDIDSEIEVLGVNDDSDTTIGNFMVDDSDVVVIDVNDEMDLDIATTNFNVTENDYREINIVEDNLEGTDEIISPVPDDLALGSDDYGTSVDDFLIDV